MEDKKQSSDSEPRQRADKLVEILCATRTNILETPSISYWCCEIHNGAIFPVYPDPQRRAARTELKRLIRGFNNKDLQCKYRVQIESAFPLKPTRLESVAKGVFIASITTAVAGAGVCVLAKTIEYLTEHSEEIQQWLYR